MNVKRIFARIALFLCLLPLALSGCKANSATAQPVAAAQPIASAQEIPAKQATQAQPAEQTEAAQPAEQTEPHDTQSGLCASSVITALGGADDTMDKTVLTYEIDLTNNTEEPIRIQTASVVFGEAVTPRILSGDTSFELNAEIQPGDTISISGNVLLDTKGMSKEQIQKLEPFLMDLVVDREDTIPLLRAEGQ